MVEEVIEEDEVIFGFCWNIGVGYYGVWESFIIGWSLWGRDIGVLELYLVL